MGLTVRSLQSFAMLLKNTITIRPPKEIRYLQQHAIPLESDKVLIVDYRVIEDQSHFMIFNKSSNLLKTFVYKGQVMAFGTLNKTQVVVLHTCPDEADAKNGFEKGFIRIIDVVSMTDEKKFKFDFRHESSFRARLFLFPESKMMLIEEIGDVSDKSGRLTFLPYPSTMGFHKDPYVVEIKDYFNQILEVLNFRNRVAVFQGKVENKITWRVLDCELRTDTPYEINKPENGAEYCLRSVIEMKQGVYLLSIEAINPSFRYMIYDSTDTKKNTLTALKAKLSDDVHDIFSVGPWLYVLEFKVNQGGEPIEAPIQAISKETQQIIFTDKGLIASGVEYHLGSTNEQFMLRIDSEYNNSKEIKVESLRATSQRELYVHMLKEVSKGQMNLEMIQSVLDSLDDEH